jgi:hypothetical protein
MAISLEALLDLIENAALEHRGLQERIDNLQTEVRVLQAQRNSIREEERAFRASLARLFPNYTEPEEPSDDDIAAAQQRESEISAKAGELLDRFSWPVVSPSGEQLLPEVTPSSRKLAEAIAENVVEAQGTEPPLDVDWSRLSRTDAVELAVRVLDETDGYATPDSIEELLAARNRADGKDSIGAALSYLRVNDRVHSIARAQWKAGVGF